MSEFPIAGAYRPTIMGTHGMVVSGHYLASLAGERILARGGNAIDAGVAAGLCLTVLQIDLIDLAGVAPMIIYLAEEDRVVTISGLGRWPQAASVAYFQQHYGGRIPTGVLRCITPGAPDAWITALELYGTMSLADVLQEAIQLADEGFPMHPFMAANLHERGSPDAPMAEQCSDFPPQRACPCARGNFRPERSGAHHAAPARCGGQRPVPQPCRGLARRARGILPWRHCSGDRGVLPLPGWLADL